MKTRSCVRWDGVCNRRLKADWHTVMNMHVHRARSRAIDWTAALDQRPCAMCFLISQPDVHINTITPHQCCQTPLSTNDDDAALLHLSLLVFARVDKHIMFCLRPNFIPRIVLMSLLAYLYNPKLGILIRLFILWKSLY